MILVDPKDRSGNHYINERALTFSENDLEDPQRIAVSLVSGTVIMVNKKDDGDGISIPRAANGDYEKWTLKGYSTKIPEGRNAAHYIFARLSRSERTALIVFSLNNYNIDGSISTFTTNEDGSVTETRSESSDDYFYIRIGYLSETDGASDRLLTYDCGQLSVGYEIDDIRGIWSELFVPHYENPANPKELTWIEAKSHMGINGGLTMFIDNGSLDLPNIYEGLLIDGDTIYWGEITDENGNVIDKVLKAKGQESATTLGSLTNVGEWADDIPETDRIMVQKGGSSDWGPLDVAGLGTASFENVKEDGEGNAYTAMELSEDKMTITLRKDDTFVSTDESEQTVEGVKTFSNGIKIGERMIRESKEDVLFLDANLVVRGGVTMYGTDSDSAPSILDSLPIASTSAKGIASFDGSYFSVTDGHVSLIPDSVGLNEDELKAYLEEKGTPKLSTTRTIWGQPFDGTADVDGLFTMMSSGERPFKIGWMTSEETVQLWSWKSGLGFADLCIGASKDSPSKALYFSGADGYWGIGTVTPEYNLHVNGSLYAKGDVLLAENSSYRVGIRTTDPQQALDVNGGLQVASGALFKSHIYKYNSDGTYRLCFAHNVSSGLDVAHIYNISSDGNTMGDLRLGTTSGVSLTITATNRVGIGTAAPEKKLHVVGESAFSRSINLLGGVSNAFASEHIKFNDGGARIGANTNNDIGIYARQIYLRPASSEAASTLGVHIDNLGVTNLLGALTVQGIKVFKSQDDVLYIDGNLVVRGGVTMYGTDSTTAPSILDSLPIASTSTKGIASFDGSYFSVTDGHVSLIPDNVGLNEEELESYLSTNKYLNGDVSISSSKDINFTLEIGSVKKTITDLISRFTSMFSGIGVTASGYDLNEHVNGGIARNYDSVSYWVNAPSGMSFGEVLNLATYNGDGLSGQLAWDINNNSQADTTKGLWWRARDYGNGFTYSKWHQIAFTDSEVDSAKKLATPRTIWGQSFDGESDVDGLFTMMSGSERPFKIGWTESGETVQLWSWESSLGFADLCIGASKDTPSKALYFSGANGYWGIGTVTPEYNLHVDGSVYAKGDVYLADNSNFRVGIRTKNPEEALDVNGGLKVAYGASFGSYIYKYNSDKTYRLCFAHNVGSSGGTVAHIYNITNDGQAYGELRLGATSGADLTITGYKIGIGTKSPEYKFHVVGESAFSKSVNLLGSTSSAFDSEHIRFNKGGARIGANSSNGLGIYAQQIYLRPASSESASTFGVHIDNLGVTNMLGALTIQGIKVSKSKDDVLYIDGNLVVRGGITMYGSGTTDAPSIMDSITVDGTTIIVDNGVLKINPDIELGGGLDYTALQDYLTQNSYLNVLEADSRYLQVNSIIDGAKRVADAYGTSGWSDANNSMREKAGIYFVHTSSGSNYGGHPSGMGIRLQRWDDTNSYTVGQQTFDIYSPYTQGGNVYIRQGKGDGTQMVYEDWYKLIHSGNYSDYALPLSGGTMKGHIYLNGTSGVWLRDVTGGAIAGFSKIPTDVAGVLSEGSNFFGSTTYSTVIRSNGVLKHRNGNVSYDLLDSNNFSSHALPLTGGEITGTLNVAGAVTFRSTLTGNYWYLNDSATNPYLRLTRDTEIWYVQAIEGSIGIGSAIAKSLKVDTEGNTSIVGSLTLTNTGDAAKANIAFSRAHGYITFPTSVNFGTATNADGTVMCVSSEGRVGINTTSPQYTLDVTGSLRASGSVYLCDNSNYRVGIRTTSPEQALDVNGGLQVRSSAYFNSTITKYNTDKSYRLVFAHNVSSGLDVAHIYNIANDWQAYGELRLGATNGAGLVVTSANRVGIGTANPDYKLHVAGNIFTNSKVNVNGIEISKSKDDVLYIDGNVVVRGGVTMYGTDSTTAPSIIDSLPIASTSTKGIASFDDSYFTVTDGHVSLVSNNAGLNEEELESYLSTNKYLKGDVTISSSKDVNLTLGIGSVKKTITDLTARFTSMFSGITVSSSGYDLNEHVNGGIARNYNSASYWVNAPSGMSFGEVLNLAIYNGDGLSGQLAWDINNNSKTDTTKGLWWRARDYSNGFTYSKWHQIAFTDSNVGSADKLSTARTIWGQSFDGTSNVKGNLKTDGNIYVTNADATNVNQDSGKIKFNSINVNDMYRSPYIQAIGGATYARKRLSIFQSNETQYDTEDGFVEVFTVLPNGNVGIGVTSPTNKLEVDGTLKTGGVIYGGKAIYSGGKTSTTDGIAGACLGTSGIYTTSSTNPYIHFFANNAKTVTQQITASTDYLSFSGATYHQGHLYLSGAKASSSSGNTSQLVLGTPSTQYVAISSNTGAVIINPSTTTTTGQIVLGVNGKNTTFRSSGNFGIGVDAPTYKLHVVGTAYISSTFSVGGSSTFTGKTTHNGGVGATFGTFSSTLSAGDTSLSSLDVSGKSVFSGNTTNYGIAYFGGGTTYYVNGSGAAKFASLTSAGAISGTTGSFSSTLSVTGATTLKSTLSVTGAATLSSTLSVTGATTLKSTLTGNYWYLNNSPTNPYLRLNKRSSTSSYWYLQSIANYVALGSTSSVSLKVDASGNAIVEGNLLVKGGITMYGSTEDTPTNKINFSIWGDEETLDDENLIADTYTNSSLLFGSDGISRLGSNIFGDLIVYGGRTIYVKSNSRPIVEGEEELGIGNTIFESNVTIEGDLVMSSADDSHVPYITSGMMNIEHLSSSTTNAEVFANACLKFGKDSVSRIGVSSSGMLCIYGGTDVYIRPNSKTSHSTNGLCIKSSGNAFLTHGLALGASAVNTTYKLHVTGNAYVTGTLTQGSDVRYKTIHKDVSLSLDTMAEAPCFEYHFNDDERKVANVGTSAQYWQVVNGVTRVNEDGILGMDYSSLGVVMGISLAKELSRFESETDRRIRLLEEENENLKKEIEQLKTA